ncbi:nicotinic acetylcholine receptor subunit type C, partial [Biomphalaria glabrata]
MNRPCGLLPVASILLVLLPCVKMDMQKQSPAAKQLFNDLMHGKIRYNALIRPSAGPEKKLTVKLGLRLSQVLSV